MTKHLNAAPPPRHRPARRRREWWRGAACAERAAELCARGLCQSFDSGLTAARLPGCGPLRAVIEQQAPAARGRDRPSCASTSTRVSLGLLGLGVRARRRAGHAAQGTFSSELQPARAVSTCLSAARTRPPGYRTPTGINMPGSTASIIGDDNLVLVVLRARRRELHLSVHARHYTPASRQAGRHGPPTRRSRRGVRPARLDPLRRDRSRDDTLDPWPRETGFMTTPSNARSVPRSACASVRAVSNLRDATVHLPKSPSQYAHAPSSSATYRLSLLDRRHRPLGRCRQPRVASARWRQILYAAPSDWCGPEAGHFRGFPRAFSFFRDDGDPALAACTRPATPCAHSVEGDYD